MAAGSSFSEVTEPAMPLWRVVLITIAFAQAAPPLPSRITTAANVRLREAPAADSAVRRELPLGTSLSMVAVAEPVAGWSRVRSDTGDEGWVSTTLTRPFDPAKPLDAIELIVRSRLPAGDDLYLASNNGGENLGSRVQLLELVERAQRIITDREASARFEWYRLRALRHALGAVPFSRWSTQQLPDALRQRLNEIRYNEPGGAWIVNYEHILSVLDRQTGTSAADDIAWFLVINNLAGECETDLPCWVSWVDRLEGEYLRRRPAGAHVGLVHWRIADRLDRTLTSIQSQPKLIAEFKPVERCTELRRHLDPLRAAVDATTSPNQEAAQAALTRYAQLCAG